MGVPSSLASRQHHGRRRTTYIRHDITAHLDFVFNSHVESQVEIGRDRWIRTILSQIVSLFRDIEKGLRSLAESSLN